MKTINNNNSYNKLLFFHEGIDVSDSDTIIFNQLGSGLSRSLPITIS